MLERSAWRMGRSKVAAWQWRSVGHGALIALCCAGSACSEGKNAIDQLFDGSIIILSDAASPSQAGQTDAQVGSSLDATTPTNQPDSTVADSSVATLNDANAVADSTVNAVDTGAAPLDAGAAPLDAGADATQPDGGSDSQIAVDAATDASLPDSGPAGDAGALVDYSQRGPYQVISEKNVGMAFRNNVNDDSLFCNLFIGVLGGSNSEVDKELTTYPADMNRGLYTLFRPSPMIEGKTYPILTWGNGTCSHPFLFAELIEHVVSHGFIVIASNSRQVGNGDVMLRGIDFLLSENENKASPLYGKIDTKMVGAFGHSQGSMATVVAGADRRIVATVPIEGASASEITKIKGPTFLIAGEKDTIVNPTGVKDAYNAATVPAVYGLSMGQDHLMPGVEPKFIWDAVVAWFKIHLAREEQARDYFYGDKCRLCTDPRWQLQRKGL